MGVCVCVCVDLESEAGKPHSLRCSRRCSLKPKVNYTFTIVATMLYGLVGTLGGLVLMTWPPRSPMCMRP